MTTTTKKENGEAPSGIPGWVHPRPCRCSCAIGPSLEGIEIVSGDGHARRSFQDSCEVPLPRLPRPPHLPPSRERGAPRMAGSERKTRTARTTPPPLPLLKRRGCCSCALGEEAVVGHRVPSQSSGDSRCSTERWKQAVKENVHFWCLSHPWEGSAGKGSLSCSGAPPPHHGSHPLPPAPALRRPSCAGASLPPVGRSSLFVSSPASLLPFFAAWPGVSPPLVPLPSPKPEQDIHSAPLCSTPIVSFLQGKTQRRTGVVVHKK